MSALTIDHLRYLKERHHRREVHAGLRRIARYRRGRQVAVRALHEYDDSCCVREPWMQTARRIVTALAADGERMLWLFIDEEGADVSVLRSS